MKITMSLDANKKLLCVLDELLNEHLLGIREEKYINIPHNFLEEMRQKCGVSFGQLIRILQRFEEDGVLAGVDFDILFSETGHQINFPQNFRTKAREYKLLLARNPDENLLKKSVVIKNARLDTSNYILEINHGEVIISFKSKKNREGLDRETKLFKLLCFLWDSHWEMKDGKVLVKGYFHTLDNLKRGSGSVTTDAAYKTITRLNALFRKRGVPISIEGTNEKYRLILYKD